MAKAPDGAPWVRVSPNSWNRVWEASEYYWRELANGRGGNGSRSQPTDTTKIRIKNSSGANRRKGEILKVGDYLLTAINKDLPWFDADLHDGTDAPFCVLLQPIKDGEFGPAQIAGVCPALVNKIHANNVYARPAASNDVLQGDVLGQVRIIHQIGTAGTGEKECLVDLNGGRYQGHGKPDANIALNATGTVSFWNGLGGSEADSGMNTTARAYGVAVTSAKIVQLALMNNVMYCGCWAP